MWNTLLLLSFIVFIVIFFYFLLFLLLFYVIYCFLHILCIFFAYYIIFLLYFLCLSPTFPFFDMKKSMFFEKFTFPMCYDRFELFFCVKSSFENGHVSTLALSVFVLRFFCFRCFFFRITIIIYSII